MARAMARGWGSPVLCSDNGSGRAEALVAELGGKATSNLEVASEADLVVLCHKPAQLQVVAREIGGQARAVASVLGGVTSGQLADAYAGVPTFKLMPNTPVEVGQGVILYAPTADADQELEREVLAVFERLGSVVTVPDNLLSVAAAVMSVGPAYHALVAEAQVDAAVRHGLAPALASRLVAETMGGTATLLRTHDYDTLAIRREVTSPGGTTARGLAALERGGVRAAFQDAIDSVCGEPGR
jgi:pyrroline-5-carboxylate reductase